MRIPYSKSVSSASRIFTIDFTEIVELCSVAAK
jgi:hypothetical protein